MAKDKDNGKRPAAPMDELERVQLIGQKAGELALLLKDDECYIGQYPISRIAGPDNKLPMRNVCVTSPIFVFQVEGIQL